LKGQEKVDLRYT